MSFKLIKKIQTVTSTIISYACIILAAVGTIFLLTRTKRKNNKSEINFAELEAKKQAREKHEKVKNNGSIDNDTADMVE